jgi:hypothetical protein
MMQQPLTHADLVEHRSPPSTYAIAALADGVPGAWFRVVENTALRAFFIGTGLYVSGFRGQRLLTGALVSSAAVSAWLLAGYRAGLMERQSSR